MSWLILCFVIPIYVAYHDGTTYTFAISVVGIGVLCYILSTYLASYFFSKRAPEVVEADLKNGKLPDGEYRWEKTFGIVPKWVSRIGLAAMGLIPSGVVIIILLALDIITNRSIN